MCYLNDTKIQNLNMLCFLSLIRPVELSNIFTFGEVKMSHLRAINGVHYPGESWEKLYPLVLMVSGPTERMNVAQWNINPSWHFQKCQHSFQKTGPRNRPFTDSHTESSDFNEEKWHSAFYFIFSKSCAQERLSGCFKHIWIKGRQVTRIGQNQQRSFEK